MGRAVIPDDILVEFNALKERVRILESTSRNAVSSIRDGAMQLQDQAGNTIVQLGRQYDGSHGIMILSPSGFPLYWFAETKGLVYPAFTVPMAATQSATTVTSGVPIQCHAGRVDTHTASAYYGLVPYVVDAATTGEIQVTCNGGTSTSVVAVGTGAGFLTLNWLHGQTIGAGPAQVIVQARRTAGVGNVFLYTPTFLWLIDGARTGAVSSPGLA